MATFHRAVKHEAKLRMALAGPAGSGKTYTAMLLAAALSDGAPFALIDTEHGSASKYADLFTFDVLELDSFHPDRYVEAIHEAEAGDYAVLVIDSLSHAWSGKDGILEQVERLTKLKHANNTFRAWADATPIQNRFIDALTGAKLHILATLRSKTEYVVETNDRGKALPRKVGTAPIQRDGVEYEFDLFGELDQENTLVIHKSRCPALSGAVIPRPGPAVAEALRTWLQGAPVPHPPLRIQASVTPVAGPRDLSAEDAQRTQRSQSSEQSARVSERVSEGRRDGEPREHVEVDEGTPASPSAAAGTPASATPSAAAKSLSARKSLTERARELGYEGDAWMALVYRLTGKRDPRELTGEDKSKLAVYLGHLAKLASASSRSGHPLASRIDADHSDDAEAEVERADAPDGKIGA